MRLMHRDSPLSPLKVPSNDSKQQQQQKKKKPEEVFVERFWGVSSANEVWMSANEV